MYCNTNSYFIGKNKNLLLERIKFHISVPKTTEIIIAFLFGTQFSPYDI